MPFPPRWRRLVLTLHVITAVGWLGTDLVLLTLGICGLAGVDPAVVYPAQGLIRLILFTPLSLLVWLVGVVNAIGARWGLCPSLVVATKLGIVTLMLALVAFALRPNLLAAWHDGATLPASAAAQPADRSGRLQQPAGAGDGPFDVQAMGSDPRPQLIRAG